VKEPQSRPPRNAVRVDEVGPTTIVARQDASKAPERRVVRGLRRAPADLDTEEAFILALLDFPTTVADLVATTGMPENKVQKILVRLVYLGIAAYCA
jgi:predicted Rossmann fold nucleotide-binding protein DprA/Smf involved in DNA uptake